MRLIIPKSTHHPTNKKPHKKVGLFELKKVSYLFQQDHLFGLAELSCLDRIDV